MRPVPDRPAAEVLRLICDAAGVRLDRFVAEHAAGIGRRRAATIIAAGAVWVNDRPARKGQRLRAGDVVEIAAAAVARERPAAASALALRVLYEDEALIAVDKPPGVAAVALRASDRDTVANFLVARHAAMAEAGGTPLEAGLVHRLDTGTSGVLLAARTPAAWGALREQFRRRAVEKRYVALVEGTLGTPRTLRDPIAHHPTRASAMLVCTDPGRARALAARPALTSIRPLQQRGEETLIEIAIATGVRHQIRAHLAAAGHPVRGDEAYGAAPAARLMLHAVALGFRHPLTGAAVLIESPLPSLWRRG